VLAWDAAGEAALDATRTGLCTAGAATARTGCAAAAGTTTRATGAGSRRAAFHLAETYDPRVLAQWRALGIRGDANRARELYARASESGVAGSQERLLGLK